MRALAIDLGARRIGLALSDPSGTLASPWQTVQRRPGDDECALLRPLVDRLSADPDGLAVIVIGLPRHLDGREHAGAARARDLARRLEVEARVPVVLQDERLTSREAESRLAERERDWRKRKSKLDAAAAAIILQEYLDTRPRPAAFPDA
jgi:putative Holliday junction resolvase